jgi:hypothetical protein
MIHDPERRKITSIPSY